ncbi:MAG TPA: hypothetical protein DCQ93_03810 [Bacteroidetes bacterium]|mgnify:CR=1 FL=1|nr:hypothetical protein [Bacteroidota bacterium]
MHEISFNKNPQVQMKNIFISMVLLCSSFALFAQDNTTGVITASEFHVTRPLREIFAENPVDENKIYTEKESHDRENRIGPKYQFTAADGPQYGNDINSIQAKMGEVPSGNGMKVNVPGQTASGFRPYDPSGAVGPNHYIQIINATTFKVYDKTTMTVILTGTLGNLWTPAVGNNGDPIVMYDKAADRWFMAQFGTSSDKKIYIAISTTNDPTGSYYTYTYVSPLFPDYLKFGVWSNGYYMTSNQSTQKVFCFERDAMIAGTPGARSLYVNYSPPKAGFFVPLPGDAADGSLPPAGAPCPIFSYSDNGWGAGYVDAMNIYNMNVTWGATPTGSITLASNIGLSAFDASYDAQWNDCPQPGTTQKLDGIGGVCMYRAQWKSWSGYNTILLNWGVKISTTQRSFKWCELRQNQSTGVWSLYQEGTYVPDADTRWMGTMAMDNNGSIGISYMKSNASSTYPGLYYTGRRSCDPLGTLPVTETLVIAGTGSQTGINRDGDYSQTTLDPDGVTFWSTSEYMGGATGSSAARTRIFSYTIPGCSLVAGVSIAQTAGTNPTCSGSSVTFTATPVNGGTTPSYQWQVDGVNAGTNSPTFTTNSLTNGQVITCIMTSNLGGVTGNPATSNSIVMTINTAVTPAVSIALTAGSNPSCAGDAKTFTATPTNGGATPSYDWRIDGISTGTTAANYSNSGLTNGQTVNCIMASSLSCASPVTASSNNIVISITSSVTPSVSIAITSGTNPTPSGASVTFTATPTNGGSSPSYQWKIGTTNVGTNSPTYTTTALVNGDVVSCVMTSNAPCASPLTATSNSITMTVTGAITYCTASSTNTSHQYIKKVVMGSISNSSGATTYSNFTSLSTNVTVGTGTSITVTRGRTYSTNIVVIFCDWNNNGSFTDAGETVYTSAVGSGPFTTSIVPPASAITGTVRMRIRLTDSNTGVNITPCGTSTYGEVEDYSLNIGAHGLSITPQDDAQQSSSSIPPTIMLSVYPNPNTGAFTVKGEKAGEYYIMDESGHLMSSFKLTEANNFTQVINSLGNGIFIIVGQNKYGITKQKVIVAK